MITNFLDTVKYAVNVYSFVIRGEGEMSGRKFAKHIRDIYGSSDERTKAILSEVEKHVVTIESTWRGTKYRVV